jgi:Ca2+-binding EF-hand superfamily protein
MHCGKLLRSLGFSLTFEEQQILRSSVDVDGSGSLALNELYKLVRMCREQEVRAAIQAFKEHSRGGSRVPVEVAKAAINLLGCGDDQEKPPRINENACAVDGDGQMVIDLHTFVRWVARQHEEKREQFRKNGGFSEDELRKLRQSFADFDEDGSGDIGRGELALLVEAFFPKMCTEARYRLALQRIIEEVDTDGNCQLDFQEFLRLMQLCRDHQDGEQMLKERQAMSDTGFTASEVTEFREILIAREGFKDGQIAASDVKEMIGGIVKLGGQREVQLIDRIRSIIKSFEGEGHEAAPMPQQPGLLHRSTAANLAQEEEPTSMDFAEFLYLMRWVLDENFGNIHKVTHGADARRMMYRQAPRTEESKLAHEVDESSLVDSDLSYASSTSCRIHTAGQRRTSMAAMVEAGSKRRHASMMMVSS